MKRISSIILLLAIIFVACNQEKSVEAIPSKTKLYAFSDSAKLDTFRITSNGKKSAAMNLVFTITNFNGKQIYKEEINATTLLKSHLAGEDLKKETEKIKFLNEQIDVFFDEEHFLEPAITEDQEPDSNTPDKSFYDELKQTKLNGFYYSLGKNTSIYVAWSVKEQKVKVYYKCC